MSAPGREMFASSNFTSSIWWLYNLYNDPQSSALFLTKAKASSNCEKSGVYSSRLYGGNMVRVNVSNPKITKWKLVNEYTVH